MDEHKTAHDDTEEGASGGSWRPSNKVLIIAGLIILSLYGLGVNSHWRFQRDSAVYMTLARSMIEGDGYTYNHEKHTKYTPGFPVMLAGTGAVFGTPDHLTDSFLPYNILVSLLGLGSIILFYYVLRELDLPPHLLWIALLLFAVSRTLYYYSIHIMTDVPFTFFTLAAFLFGLRTLKREGWRSWANCAVCGIMVLCACMIRPVGPFLLIAIPAGLWIRRDALQKWTRKLGQTALLWAPNIAALLAYSLWMQSLEPSGDGGSHYFRGKLAFRYVMRFFHTIWGKLPDHFRGISDTLMGTDAGPVVGIILAIVLLVGIIRALKVGKERQMSFFALLLGGVIIAGGWDLGRRYLLPASPVMFYWLVLGGDAIGGWLREKYDWWTARRVRKLGYICIALVVLSNLIRIGDVIIEQRGAFYRDIEGGKLAGYLEVLPWLRENATAGSTVAGYEGEMVHYFTRLKTEKLPHYTDRPGFDQKWAQKKLRQHDYIVIDFDKPESTAAIEKFAPKTSYDLKPVVESNGIKLLQTIKASQ